MKDNKVLIVGPLPPPFGGIATYLENLLKSELIKNKFKLFSFNTSIPERIRHSRRTRLRSYEAWKEVGIISFLKTVTYVIFSFFRFTVVLLNRQISIVHIHTGSFWEFWKNSGFLVIAKILKRKVIFHIHGAIEKFYLYEARIFGRFLIRKVLNLSDKIVVLSDGLKRFVSTLTNTPVISVYNGIDIEPFNQIVRREGSAGEKKLIILSLAPLSKDKGVDDTILAIPRVANQINNVHFIFAGRGEIEKYRDLVRENGVEEFCSFLGVITEDEKRELFKKATIFLLPSYAEGQPIAILEAMAAGLPVISTAVGSIPEVIKDGENGFLIEPGDYRELAEKIILLVADGKFRERIGKKNYEIVREKHDIRRVVREIDEAYESLLKNESYDATPRLYKHIN